MNNKESNTYEAIWDILEFYRIQPKVKELQMEKIEEYLIVMNAHYKESITEINDCIDSNESVELEDVVDVLNSYLNKVGEELVKIFPNKAIDIFPIQMHSNTEFTEVQLIELYFNFNGRESNLYQVNEALDDLENDLYDEKFVGKLATITKELIIKINSKIIVQVDDLI